MYEKRVFDTILQDWLGVMTLGRKLGYARVSTQDQKLELQIDALKEAGVEERDIFKEKFTGSKKEKPVLDKLMEYAEPGDTIVVWKLDRMGRSIRHLIELMEHYKVLNQEIEKIKQRMHNNPTVNKISCSKIVPFKPI
jgi:DNA invertase Pin-like site-specific DNA recombinase